MNHAISLGQEEVAKSWAKLIEDQNAKVIQTVEFKKQVPNFTHFMAAVQNKIGTLRDYQDKINKLPPVMTNEERYE